MRNRRKRKQREEIRKILHAMRLELAAQRAAQERAIKPARTLPLNELILRARQSVTG